FQAEDGIRDFHVTGVQTCALPICIMLLITTGVTLCCQVLVSVCLGVRHCLCVQRANCCWERGRFARICAHVHLLVPQSSWARCLPPLGASLLAAILPLLTIAVRILVYEHTASRRIVASAQPSSRTL